MSIRRKLALWLCPELGEEITLLTLSPKAFSWVEGGEKQQAEMNAVAAKHSADSAAQSLGLLSEVIALRNAVEAMRQDMRSQAESLLPFVQVATKTIRRWDAEGMPSSRG